MANLVTAAPTELSLASERKGLEADLIVNARVAIIQILEQESIAYRGLVPNKYARIPPVAEFRPGQPDADPSATATG